MFFMLNIYLTLTKKSNVQSGGVVTKQLQEMFDIVPKHNVFKNEFNGVAALMDIEHVKHLTLEEYITMIIDKFPDLKKHIPSAKDLNIQTVFAALTAELPMLSFLRDYIPNLAKMFKSLQWYFAVL